MNFINKLERKFGKYAIHNLMYYIIAIYVLGWIIQLVAPEIYTSYLSLNAEAILHGQVWRIVTFLLNPPSSSPLFMIFALYLYFIIGMNIERAWGAFRFNLYFFVGVLLHVIAAIIIYLIFGINLDLGTYYLNLSLFFTFAALYPNMQLLLFFIIPIKIKWIALLNGVFFAATIIFGIAINFLPEVAQYNLFTNLYRFGVIATLPSSIAALVSMLNFIIFFFATRNYKRVSPKEVHRRNVYKRQVNEHTRKDSQARHKCAVCGRTEKDSEDLVFRYCSKCHGGYEYCQDHLFTHEHK